MSAARTGATGAHDPLFTTEVRRAFMARLNDFGIKYNELASELERLGLPRPSGGSGLYRRMITDAAPFAGCDAITLAEQVAPLYRPAIHARATVPADDAGYIAALTAPLAPPTERPPVAAPVLITAAQIRFMRRIGLVSAAEAATIIARMTAAQRAAALTLALRLSAMPGATEAANRLRGAA